MPNDKEYYISEEKLIHSLAQLYNRKSDYKLPIAILCDVYIDTSGKLLGKVRSESLKYKETQYSLGPQPLRPMISGDSCK